jgi:dynein heavy chain
MMEAKVNNINSFEW